MLVLQFLVLIIYSVPFYFLVSPLSQYLLLLVGLLAGRIFLLLDENFLFKFYQDKDASTESSMRNESQNQTSTNNVSNPVVAGSASPVKTFVTRSVMFLLAYVALAFYMITSGGNRLAQGLVLGMGLTLLMEMWQRRNMPVAFNQYFLAQLKISIDKKAIAKVILAMFFFLLILTVKIL